MSSQLFRSHGLNTYYPGQDSAVTIDTTLVSIGAAACFLGFAWLLCFPTFKSKLRTAAVHFGYLYSLGVFTSILLGQWGYDWDNTTIVTRTQYKNLGANYVRAQIGLRIGLRGFNVTMLGLPEYQLGERINYNEQFWWTWQQLRGGFGIHSGRINREFHDAQTRGRPLPILWVAEYFTLDGEWIRWGRYYRWAGFYTHIFLWAALPLWFLALCLFPLVTKPAALLAATSGCLMVMSCILWSSISRNAVPNLIIPWEDAVMRPAYGWCFYLVLLMGISVWVMGLALWVLATWYRFDERFRFIASATVDSAPRRLNPVKEAAPAPVRADTFDANALLNKSEPAHVAAKRSISDNLAAKMAAAKTVSDLEMQQMDTVARSSTSANEALAVPVAAGTKGTAGKNGSSGTRTPEESHNDDSHMKLVINVDGESHE